MCHACVCTGSFVLECHALYLQHFLFIEKKAAKDVEPFRNGSVHEFYRLKALITLEHGIDYFSGGKKNLNEQNFEGEGNWLGVENSHCMLMVL